MDTIHKLSICPMVKATSTTAGYEVYLLGLNSIGYAISHDRW